MSEGTRVQLEDFVTAEQLAEWLGVSRRAVNSWRGVPRVQIGTHRFYLKQDVAEYLISRRVG